RLEPRRKGKVRSPTNNKNPRKGEWFVVFFPPKTSIAGEHPTPAGLPVSLSSSSPSPSLSLSCRLSRFGSDGYAVARADEPHPWRLPLAAPAPGRAMRSIVEPSRAFHPGGGSPRCAALRPV